MTQSARYAVHLINASRSRPRAPRAPLCLRAGASSRGSQKLATACIARPRRAVQLLVLASLLHYPWALRLTLVLLGTVPACQRGSYSLVTVLSLARAGSVARRAHTFRQSQRPSPTAWPSLSVVDLSFRHMFGQLPSRRPFAPRLPRPSLTCRVYHSRPVPAPVGKAVEDTPWFLALTSRRIDHETSKLCATPIVQSRCSLWLQVKPQ